MVLFRKLLILAMTLLLFLGLTGCVIIGYGGTRASGGGMIADIAAA